MPRLLGAFQRQPLASRRQQRLAARAIRHAASLVGAASVPAMIYGDGLRKIPLRSRTRAMVIAPRFSARVALDMLITYDIR